MNRFLEVLMEIERDPAKTNDLKSVDVFRILENFINEALTDFAAGLTEAQLCQFVLVLESYSRQELSKDWYCQAEKVHRGRRDRFMKDMERRNWLKRLQEKVGL
jgi:hypothetical protein